MSRGSSVVSCPDCSARAGDSGLVHDDGCPVGRDCDRQLFDDGQFFRAHPEATERRRPPFYSEVVMLRSIGAMPPLGEVAGEVVVYQLADGVRMKELGELVVLLPTDQESVDEVLAWAKKRQRS